MSLSVRQTSYDLMCRALRRVLRDAVQAGPGAAGGIGSVECQAVATLYMLLMDHPIDQRGRCRSCRRPGAVFGPRWRRCRVHGKATLCLHQLNEVLLQRLLTHELGLATAPSPAASGRAPASDPEDTDVLPAIAADSPDQPLQTPRRGPSEDPSPGPGTGCVVSPGLGTSPTGEPGAGDADSADAAGLAAGGVTYQAGPPSDPAP